MKKKCLVALALVVLGLAFLHLGPHLYLVRGEQVIAVSRLQDGSQLILSQSANNSLAEAYTVRLYRLYSDGRAERCLVGFEESYWWFGNLKVKSTNVVELRTWGLPACTYRIDTKVL